MSQMGRLSTFSVINVQARCVYATSRGRLNFYTNARHDINDHIFVFFSDEKSVGVKTMRKYDDMYSPCALRLECL
jgi:hypothetical protein